MNKYKKLISDTALFMVSNFASKALVFVLLPLYTNILSTEEYGIADLMTATINLIYPILTLSISEAVLRFVMEKHNDKKEVLSSSLLLILAGTLLLSLSKPIVALFSPELDTYWLYFCLMYLSVTLQACFSNYTKGVNKTKIFAMQGFIHTIALVALNILFLVVIKIDLQGYLLSIIIANFCSVIYMILCGRFIGDMFAKRINYSLFKDMLRYSMPMIPTIIAWWIIQTSSKYMIIAMKGIEVSGVYSVAYKIPSILSVITSIFAQAWQISAISNYGEKDNSSFINTVYKYFNLVSVLACAALVLLAKITGKILYANEFFQAWTYVPPLLLAFVFNGLSGFLAAIFTSSKKTHILMLSTGLGAIISIVLNCIFIPMWGAMGAAITTMLGFAATWAMRLYCSKKLVSIDISLKKDCLVYALLIGEIIVMSCDMTLKYPISIAIIAAICLIERKELAYIINMCLSLVKQITKKNGV